MLDSRRLATHFEALSAPLVLYARQFLDHAAAEDVAHDAFVSLMAQSREPDDVRAWMFRAVRNAAISRKRAWWRRMRRERVVSETRGEMFESRIDDLIDARLAEESLRMLPPEQREVVVLRIWAQMTFAEIAGVVGTSLSTVHDRFRQALATLKRELEKTSCRTKNLT
jgi:RNA polymerase sigma-70 factor (ECF subfamily)